MKKILSILLISILSSFLLFGCGGTGDTEVTKSGNRDTIEVTKSGSGMGNAIYDDDKVEIDKNFGNIERYDIVAYQVNGNNAYIQRVYALPNETIQIKNNAIFINGSKIDDKYATTETEDAGIAEEPYTLGKDEYFALGDNRSVSIDSRMTTEECSDAPGPISKNQIIGVAKRVYQTIRDEWEEIEK